MSEECIICGEDGGCYLSYGPFKTGPYCSRHRWELGTYVLKRRKQIGEDQFNGWVDEFLKLKKAK